MNNHNNLFKITKDLVGHKGEITFPSYTSDNELANKFSDFLKRVQMSNLKANI